MIIESTSLPGIQILNPSSKINETHSTQKTTPSGNAFETIFNAYLDMYNETNLHQLQAEKMQLDYAAGRTDDMVSLNLVMEKASASLNFTIQVTNKVLNAYQEIMRMQI